MYNGGVFFLLLICLSVLPCMASEGSVSLKNAQKKYPALFIPGRVSEMVIEGESSYVFNGHAEKLFADDCESELQREAILDAKNNFYFFLVKNDKSKTVELKNVQILYQYMEGNSYNVVLYVHKENVSIIQQHMHEPEQSRSTIDTDKMSDGIEMMTCSEDSKIAEFSVDTTQTVIEKPGENTLNVITEAMDPVTTKQVIDNDVKDDVSDSNEVHRQKIEQDSTDMAQTSTTGEMPARVEDLSMKISILKKKTEDNPQDLFMLARLARLYIKKCDYNEASSEYLKIISAFSQINNCEQRVAVELLSEAGDYFETRHEYEYALKAYRLLLRLNDMQRWRIPEAKDINLKISRLLLKNND